MGTHTQIDMLSTQVAVSSVFVIFIYSVANAAAQSSCPKPIVRREILKKGFHRDLVTRVNVQGFAEQVKSCRVLIRETIPSGLFLDPYQLSSLQQHNLTEVVLLSSVDVEAPEYLSTGNTALVYAKPDQSCDHCFISTVPVHARYHRPSAQAHDISLVLQNPQLLIYCSEVRQRSATDRPQPTDGDGGNAGSSSASRPPLRRPSQGSVSLPRRPSKTRRVESDSAAPSSPPRRRISAVLAQPPQATLASPQSDEPRSPQLSDPTIMAEDDQQEPDQQPTFTLHLTPVDPTQPTQQQDMPQASVRPQLIPTPPQQQMSADFWTSWATQQVQNTAYLNTHTQHLASLPHHLLRISRNSGRLIVQVGRIATSMEQIRADNTQMLSNLTRIIDEQQRQQQALIQVIQHNQVVNETLSRIVASNTATNNQLNASIHNLSQSITLMAAQQASSSSGTTTPSQTPVTSPVRRSSRTRPSDPAQTSAPSTQKKKMKNT
ncbi:phosphatidylinositol-glycan biosynthesis class X protein [Pseudophryne corroboree]|uniref:phosphatidylinositol-glycan biosynthesis class X protein n=1 Tax=Pseudophryne corroboree TaxID=495146 RepID=UPI003081A687